MSNKLLCIHHFPCQDGFGAAYAVWKRFKDEVEFHPGVHGEPPPDVTGRHVIMVDFSYKAGVIMDMAHQAKSILVLDHHKTAEAELAEFPEASATWDEHLRQPAVVGVQFDMTQSGAVMAWHYFHPGVPVPQLLLHIQDRDLWRFKLSDTKAISSWLFSQPYDFGAWDGFAGMCDNTYQRSKMRDEGHAILRAHNKDVAELIPATKRTMVIGGYEVPVANLPYTMCSDAGNIMAEDAPFAATYFDGAEHRHFSLRSREGGFDVSQIAHMYGGGGHKHAAGFQRVIGWEGDPHE